jgi:hypothetical protein
MGGQWYFGRRKEIERMTKPLQVAASLLVSIAFGATAASPASATWFVEGEELAEGSTAALATTAQVDEAMVLNAPSLGVKLTCTGGADKVLAAQQPFIQSPNAVGAESLTFEGCSEIAPSNCSISEALSTEPVIAAAEERTASLVRLLLTPRTGRTLTGIAFKGSCSLAGEQPLNGQVALDAPELHAAHAVQPVEALGTTENNSLELSKVKVNIRGKASIDLPERKLWRFVVNQIIVNKKLLDFEAAGVKSVVFKNENPEGNWSPKKDKLKMINKTDTVWIRRDECTVKVIKPKEECVVEVKFTPNGETGVFMAELELEGAPPSANVRLEGEE